MASVSTLRDRIILSSDRELIGMITSPGDFTPAAVELAREEIAYRGGEELLRTRVAGAMERARLLQSLVPDIRSRLQEGGNPAEIARALEPNDAVGEDLLLLIDRIDAAMRKEQHETTDTPRSKATAFIGVAASAIIGGIASSLLFFNSDKIFYIHVMALIGMCYGLVRWSAGGRRTNYVLVLTAVAVLLALTLGSLLHQYGVFASEAP